MRHNSGILFSFPNVLFFQFPIRINQSRALIKLQSFRSVNNPPLARHDIGVYKLLFPPIFVPDLGDFFFLFYCYRSFLFRKFYCTSFFPPPESRNLPQIKTFPVLFPPGILPLILVSVRIRWIPCFSPQCRHFS